MIFNQEFLSSLYKIIYTLKGKNFTNPFFFRFYKKNSLNIIHITEILFLAFIIVLSFFLGSYLRDIPLNVIWYADDAIHISVAKGFKERLSFETDFTRNFQRYSGTLSIDSLINEFPNITKPHIPKGPVGYILLGSMYKLVGTEPQDLYLHASFFNNILNSIFISLFFFWTKKRFNLTVSIFSSILVILIPFVAYMSARIYLYPTLFILALGALFFIEKKKSHYIIFGILAGLAHLTHPYGIFLPISYVVFLLLNREFKGAFLTLLSWNLVLIPWLIRNYYHFQDIGRGLYIPFSDKISSILLFLPHREDVIHTIPRIPDTIISEGNRLWEPYYIFNERSYQFIANFNWDYTILFIIAFVGFSFFAIEKFRREQIKYILATVLTLVVIYIVSSFLGAYLQIMLVFLLPLILVYSLTKLKPSLLKKPIPRIYRFVILYGFINMIGVYLWSLSSPPSHSFSTVFLFGTILLTPLAFLGLMNLIHRFSMNFNLSYFIPIIIISLIISPIIIHQAEGIMIYNNVPSLHYLENDQIKEVNEIIRNELTSENNIGSNLPSTISIKTGLKSVLIPRILQLKDLDRLVDNYNLSYLVLYDLSRFGAPSYSSLITEHYTKNYRFIITHSIQDSYIIKVEKQTEEYLKEKISEYLTLGKYSQALEGYNTIVGFYDGRIDQLKKSGQLDTANTVQLSLESFTKERDDFVFTVADSNKKIIQKLVESNQYFEVMEVFDETIDFFEIYVTQSAIINQEKKAKIQQLIEEFKIGQHISLMAWDELLRKEVPILLDLKDDEEAIEFYKSLRDYYQKHYKTFEKSGNFNDAKKIKNSLVEYVGYNARLFMDHEMLHDAERAYLFLINIDKYDRKVWAEFGELYERMGRLLEALSAYNKANLLPDKDYTDKIEELKSKLES